MYKSNPVLSSISAKMDNMTKMQVKIAKYVQKNPHQVVKLTISELAAVTGLKSESAIVRFYKVLGFSGYHEFKVSLATEIAGKSFYHTYSDLTGNDTIEDVKDKIFNGIIRTLHENYSLVSENLLETGAELLMNAKRIFFIGFGQSGNLCSSAAFKFMRLGYECYSHQDSHYNCIHLTEPREGDVLFCISFSGLSKDVVVLAKECRPVAKIIALTESAKSPLGKIADICFPTHTEELNYSTDIMMGRYVQSMIIDMLYMSLIIKKGEDTRSMMSRSRKALSYLKF